MRSKAIEATTEDFTLEEFTYLLSLLTPENRAKVDFRIRVQFAHDMATKPRLQKKNPDLWYRFKHLTHLPANLPHDFDAAKLEAEAKAATLPA